MRRSGRRPPWIARLSSRWLGCCAGSRSPRRVRGSGSEAGVPFNRKRGALSSRGDHAALRTRWPSGRLKPMDNAALLASGIQAPSRARQLRRPCSPGCSIRSCRRQGARCGRADLPRGRSADPSERKVPAARAAALRTRSRPPGRLESDVPARIVSGTSDSETACRDPRVHPRRRRAQPLPLARLTAPRFDNPGPARDVRRGRRGGRDRAGGRELTIP